MTKKSKASRERIEFVQGSKVPEGSIDVSPFVNAGVHTGVFVATTLVEIGCAAVLRVMRDDDEFGSWAGKQVGREAAMTIANGPDVERMKATITRVVERYEEIVAQREAKGTA